MQKGIKRSVYIDDITNTTFLYVLVILACVFIPENNVDILYGIKFEPDAATVDYYKFARWIIIVFFPSFVRLIKIYELDQMNYSVQLRLGGIKKYEKYMLNTSVVHALIWSGILLLVVLIFEKDYLIEYAILFFSYELLMTTITSSISIAFKKNELTIIVVLLVYVISFSLGEYAKKDSLASVGMICRSSVNKEDGFSNLDMTLTFVVLTLLIRFFMVRRRELWEKLRLIMSQKQSGTK